jgi:hypothetical protein
MSLDGIKSIIKGKIMSDFVSEDGIRMDELIEKTMKYDWRLRLKVKKLKAQGYPGRKPLRRIGYVVRGGKYTTDLLVRVGGLIDLECPEKPTCIYLRIDGKALKLDVPTEANLVRLVEENGVFSLIKAKAA